MRLLCSDSHFAHVTRHDECNIWTWIDAHAQLLWKLLLNHRSFLLTAALPWLTAQALAPQHAAAAATAADTHRREQTPAASGAPLLPLLYGGSRLKQDAKTLAPGTGWMDVPKLLPAGRRGRPAGAAIKPRTPEPISGNHGRDC